MLEARALDDWPPDYGDWPDIVELLTATILRDDPKFARAEQDITNDALACISALASVRTYIYAAQIQMRRIDEDLASTEYLAYWQAFADIHFYFICWSRVLAMITLVEERSGLSVQAPPSDRAELERYKAARHHLEHHAERLPGGPRMFRPESDSLDLGNLWATVNRDTGRTGTSCGTSAKRAWLRCEKSHLGSRRMSSTPPCVHANAAQEPRRPGD